MSTTRGALCPKWCIGHTGDATDPFDAGYHFGDEVEIDLSLEPDSDGLIRSVDGFPYQTAGAVPQVEVNGNVRSLTPDEARQLATALLAAAKELS